MKLRVRNIKAIIEAVEELEIRYFEKSITLPDDEMIQQKYIYKISDIVKNMGLKRFISNSDNNKIIKIKYKEIKPQIKQLQKEVKSFINELELIINKYPDKYIEECYQGIYILLDELLKAHIPALKPVKRKDIQKAIENKADEIVELLEAVKRDKDYDFIDVIQDQLNIFYSYSSDLERL